MQKYPKKWLETSKQSEGEAMYCVSGEDILELTWTKGVWIYTLILGMSEWLKHAKSQFHFQLSRKQMQGKSIETGERTSFSIWWTVCWGGGLSVRTFVLDHGFPQSVSEFIWTSSKDGAPRSKGLMYTHGLWSTILKFWISYSLLVPPNSYKNAWRAKELPSLRLKLRTKTKCQASRTGGPETSGNVEPMECTGRIETCKRRARGGSQYCECL